MEEGLGQPELIAVFPDSARIQPWSRWQTGVTYNKLEACSRYP